MDPLKIALMGISGYVVGELGGVNSLGVANIWALTELARQLLDNAIRPDPSKNSVIIIGIMGSLSTFAMKKAELISGVASPIFMSLMFGMSISIISPLVDKMNAIH